MLDFFLKLIEFLSKTIDASAERRRKTFDEYVAPLYRDLERVNNELIRALRAVRTAAETTTDIQALHGVIATERNAGRADRTAIYSQAKVLQHAVSDIKVQREHRAALLGRAFVRDNFAKTLGFAMACDAYFEQDGKYWHELSHLEHNITGYVQAVRHSAGRKRGELLEWGREYLEDCDGYIDDRNARWASVATAYAECRIELLGI